MPSDLIRVRQIASPVGVGDWPHRVARVTGINLKSVAGTRLYTGPPTGKIFVPIGVYVRPSAASAITIAASASVGKTNGATDIYPADSMVQLLTVGKAWIFPTLGITAIVSAGQEVWFNVTVAATGTSQVATVDLVGMLLEAS